MLYVAIVGSTQLTEKQCVLARFLIESMLFRYSATFDEVTVVSGGAPGVDAIAEQASIDILGRHPLIYYPKNYRWEPDGYRDRNIQIAKKCDELICVRSVHATTYGSGWTADYAESNLYKEVRRYFV